MGALQDGDSTFHFNIYSIYRVNTNSIQGD